MGRIDNPRVRVVAIATATCFAAVMLATWEPSWSGFISGNGCGWPVGSGVYSGTALNWSMQTFDLSAYSGPIYLRWVFSTDGGVTADGWWLDSISISPALVPGTCGARETAVFDNGFE